jgi:hypothetical protein
MSGDTQAFEAEQARRKRDVQERMVEMTEGTWVADDDKPDAFFGKHAYEILQSVFKINQELRAKVLQLEGTA